MKRHLTKKNILITVLSITAIIILIYSCNKNNDSSSISPASQENPSVAQNYVYAGTDSYTITDKDGHVIGINGVKPAVNPKNGSPMSTQGCAAANSLFVAAQSGTGSCYLTTGWIPGSGYYISLYINGQPYKDPNTGYGLFIITVSGINAIIAGGISGGQGFNVFVRTYCSSDTTASYYDCPVNAYVAPSGFLCTSGGSTITGGTVKGHHGK